MLWKEIVEEIKGWKNHVFGILSFFIKFIAPMVFVFAKSMTTKETRQTPATWGILVLIIIALIYYGVLRRVLTAKRTEEHLVKRLNKEAVKPLRMIIFTLFDEIIVMPIIPFILWLVCDLLQKLCVNISLSFLAVAIMFIIGGILKLVDVVLDLNRMYKGE